MIFMRIPKEEQEDWYDNMINRLLYEDGFLSWVLEHLDIVPEERVNWINYDSKYHTSFPKKYASTPKKH